MAYVPVALRQDLVIRALYSIHYFQFAAGYIFPGESHDFWEMVYLDHGEADIGAGEQTYLLRQGDLIFHQPNEFHRIWANRPTAPNIVVISFDCRSRAMNRLRGQRFTLDSAQRKLLTQLVAEAQQCFGPLLDIHRSLIPRSAQPQGGQQLIGVYLQQLLLSLIREGKPATGELCALPRGEDEQRAAEVTQLLQRHMRAHLDGSLRFETLCRLSGMGATALKALFNRYNGMGVMACYRQLRIEEARRMLRAGQYNVSEIADRLGYPNVHAFSNQFRKMSGMSPTDYQRSIKY